MNSNPVKDKYNKVINEGDVVRYYDSTTMLLSGKIINVGSALAVETPENPIPLYEFTVGYCNGYVYDGRPIDELEIVS